MKILIDMNLSPRWIDVFTAAGLQALHWSMVGSQNASDKEIVTWAIANDFVVMTHDLDFSAILASTKSSKPSVIQIRGDDVSPDVIGDKVLRAIFQMESELEGGALLSIDAKHTRMRILPLIQ